MNGDRYFSYYYGRECEQFTFFRIPKILISDPYFSSLSAEAKLLYGLMLDRMSLSQQNAWFDEEGRVFIIFTNKEIQRELGVGKNTACKLTTQLVNFGLIRKVRRIPGLPDLIYVMNFASGERPGEPEYNLPLTEEQAWAAGFDSPEEANRFFRGETMEAEEATAETAEARSCGSTAQETAAAENSRSENAAFPRSADTMETKKQKKLVTFVSKPIRAKKREDDLTGQKCTDPQDADRKQETSAYARENPENPGSLKTKPLDRSLEKKPPQSGVDSAGQRFKNQTPGVPKFGTYNNTDINKTKIDSSSSTSSLSPSCSPEHPVLPRRETGAVTRDRPNFFDPNDYSEGLRYTELIEAVKEKIEYDALIRDYGEKEVYLFPHLIAEMLYTCRNKTEIRVGSNVYEAEILKQRFLSLTLDHIRHVLFMIQENHVSPGNIRNYYIQMLYNAAVTTETYYVRRVDYDMHNKRMAV